MGTNAIYLTSVPGSNEGHVESVPLAGGTPKEIADLKPWVATWLVADDGGIYLDQADASATPGIYALSSSGAATLFAASGTASDSVNPRELALDATNVYWVAGGTGAGQASLYAKAR